MSSKFAYKELKHLPHSLHCIGTPLSSDHCNVHWKEMDNTINPN